MGVAGVAIATVIFSLTLYIYLKISIKKKKDYVLFVNSDESKEQIESYKKKLMVDKEMKAGLKAMKNAQKEEAPSILADDEDNDGGNENGSDN